ncbi:MAG: DUF4261 domain-containing protein [Planctomycetales bacterium]|nr:DUF4261 domain-containing protein [Planctomycetales bacterium]
MAIGISMIMLTADAPICAEDLHQQLAEYWRGLPPVSEFNEDDGTLSLEIGGASLIIAKMPAPIPWSDLAGPCATSLLWKNAADEVKQHTVHWIVTITGDLEPLRLTKILTQATAAALATCEEAIGVYWGKATLVIPKNIFIDFTKQVLPHGAPMHIWVDFRVGKDSDTSSSGFTVGMKALGHMELETQGAPEPPSELRERLLALAGYVVENGPVIQDGDTVGEDAQERIRVVYSDSSFGHEDKVMRLTYETASTKNPWWKPW